MTTLVPRPSGQLAKATRSPVDDWPAEARQLADELAALYPDGDPLPAVAGAWIARQKRANTRQSYARQYKVWDQYAREAGTHPFEARFTLAEAFSRYLETAPTLVPVKGGYRGERAPTGPPRSDTSRANLLSACSSFHAYAVRARGKGADPFDLVARPDIDPDYSPTKGNTEDEAARLIDAAYEDGPRSYALVCVIYTMAMRLDMTLKAKVDKLGHSEGHRVLDVELKGGRHVLKPVPPETGHAIDVLLDGRTTGYIFQTRTGKPLDPKYVWKLLRRLAAAAGIKNAATFHPHVLKHDAITHALKAPGAKLHHVQDFADHKDPRTTRRYDRRRGALSSSPAYGVAARLAERRTPPETETPA
ncbi:tyrosine-type recombinase/integrase [Streptomyces sp. ME02-6979.5a]|uniref:tyrosine-type recombinase/integrase n=1 Tax=unclassified Streptomyces TaxID=2593676 RepID=UPI0029A8E61B|nr:MULTISPECIES: tyrosine-type recombinase/integrase [unclassified Streptomyces]MDX3343737.1 tyrosine-type recombinase/integrase [Streptomyces sp. ME02-6979.5a]MDX5526205.1 tyrosine-type recombinase/integrase [Streptomyces sp. DE06-01C]